MSGAGHIAHTYHSSELPCPVSDKNPSNQYLLGPGQEIDPCILVPDVYVSYVDLDLTLPVSHFQFGKTHIFSFYSALVSIYVRNQSAIIRHIITPLVYILCKYPLKV
jgi:hypothetical protein